MNKVAYYINNNLDIAVEYQRIFHKPIPSGKMFCPFHTNKNTPAAKRYGNIIKCFSCRKAFTVYDLLKKFDPDRIQEIKKSVVMDDHYENSKSFKLFSIDKSLPMKGVLDSIITHYNI